MYMRTISFNLVKTALGLSSRTMKGSGVLLSTAPPQETQASSKKKRLIWFDLEMTGLDSTVDHIMEVACLVTDNDLNIIGAGVDIIINQPDSILDTMNDWCKVHHTQSGLTDSCKNSTISLIEAENQLLSYLEKHSEKGACPLAGNSVYYDRIFLMKYMPRVHEYMHYRTVDVSSLKELCRRWAPKTYGGAPRKKRTHRALEDIKESIQELKYYKTSLFKLE